MRALKKGMSGTDVKKWQYFLIGQGYDKIVADGAFGPITEQATIDFQNRNGLKPDGVVGTYTLTKAGTMGYELVKNPVDQAQDGIHWPPPPDFKPFSQSELRERFGAFAYDVNPNGSLRVKDNWASQNLVTVTVPAMPKLPPYGTNKITVHKKVAPHFEKMFDDWKNAGLTDRLLTYDGAYNPRLVRGSTTSISSHAFGIAIDLNAASNPLGAIPPKTSGPGSVRELVEIANRNGFYWGGHFSRKDGMHFEVARLRTEQT